MGQWIVNGLSVVSCLECRFMSQVYIYIFIYTHISELRKTRDGYRRDYTALFDRVIFSYNNPCRPACIYDKMGDFIFRSSNK